MTAERWEQVKAVFHDAVECDPPARAEFLRLRCGNDEELRREVESLLASENDSRSVLESKVMGSGMLAATLPKAPAQPDIMGDRYEVERELGRGGMSVVYLARDRQVLSKRVVVKVLLAETGKDPWIRQKFLQEMEALARIDHPGVVGVVDSGVTVEGQRFLVMQYIEGVTLRSAIEPGGMNVARAAGLIRQIGQALAAAHEKGVWHRDVKPENVMLQCLGGEDHVKLIDFGIAGIQNSQFTGEGTKVAGSFAYMAPEQMGGHPCAASDTYALAVVAYEILTGETPNPTGQSSIQLPEAARRSIRRALSLRPEARQSSVREFSEELYQALGGGGPVRKTGVPGAVEMAHVLFTDLVGYSLLPMDRQKEYLEELQQIVHESPQFQASEAAGDIISLPTGDGMALAFFGDPTAPAQCALEVAAGLKSRPHLELRMGIHAGPVYRVADVNANANVAGGGINMAQRVMDCGDAGHILVSNTVAEVLLQLSQWSPLLTDLGECTVKHGVKVHLYNLATADAGNRRVPRKLAVAKAPAFRSKTLLAAVLALVLLAAGGALWVGRSRMGAPAEQPSIAVLPFVDMSAEKNQEYFSEGIAEELRDSLAKIPGLRVTGRLSSAKAKSESQDTRAIGKELHVTTILQGSVRKDGNRVRTAVQLINAKDGSQMWSQTFPHEMTDVLAVEEQIARAVTRALSLTLVGGKTPVAEAAKTTNGEAYNAYLQGRYFQEQGSQENLAKAEGYYEQATKLDPQYAPAWVGLGDCLTDQAGKTYIPREDGYRRAREAVERALTLDPNLAEAYSVMGVIQMLHDWDWNSADASSQRALALKPDDADVLRSAGARARVLGRLDEAIMLYNRAIVIDPLVGYYGLALNLHYAGRQAEAKAAAEKQLDLTPKRGEVYVLLCRIYLALSQPQEALGEAEKEPHPIWRVFGQTLANHALGRKKESDAGLAELIGKYQADAPYVIAGVFAFRGETDHAFEWLERAYKARDDGLSEMKTDPLMNSLKGDPRYSALLEKVGLAH